MVGTAIAGLVTRSGRRRRAAAGFGLLAVLAGCGGGSGSATASGLPGAALSGAAPAASGPAGATGSASTGGGSRFSCAIKAGHGLLPGATPAPGRILASVDAIEAAIGFSIDTSVDVSEVAGLTECRYAFSGGSSVDITILDDPARSDTEYTATQSRRIALHDRACNGCRLDSITPASGLGDRAYTGASNDGSMVLGVVAAGVYFELNSASLKPARLQRLAATMVGTLTGNAPSLQPLPTPTPTAS